MAGTTQASLTVRLSENASQGVRDYIAEAGESAPDAMTQFVEDAVQLRLLDLSLQKIRSAFDDLSEQEVEDLVQEAITWARSPEGRQRES